MNRLNTFILGLLVISSISPWITYQFTPDDNIDFTTELVVGTYNLHYGINGEGVYELSGLTDLLKEYKPDFIGFQEVSYASPYNGYVNFHQDMVNSMTKLGYTDHYIAEGDIYNLANSFSSRYSIKAGKTIVYNSQNTYQRHILDVRVSIGSSVVQILNTHLTHIPTTTESSEVRISQVGQLVDYAEKTKNEVDYQIFMGDFNVRMMYEGNVTPEYEILNASYYDAWILSGSSGEGLTSPAKDPLKRIDFIWVGENISVLDCNVVETTVSDHFPLFCTIVLT